MTLRLRLTAPLLMVLVPAVALGKGISKVPGSLQVSLGGSGWD